MIVAIRKGRRSNYFEGTVKAKAQFVAFTAIGIVGEAIRLDDCEVKQASRGEIMLKGTTTINVSPKVFDIPIE